MTVPYQPAGAFVLPAGRGKAIRVAPGTLVKITNPYGTQAIDFWAYNAEDTAEYVSTEHIRSVNSTVPVNKATRIVSWKRRPLVSIAEDTSSGDHDTLLCACNAAIYAELGCEGYHRSCADNLHEGLGELGVEVPFTPGPVNLFMSVRAEPGGTLTRLLPTSKPGSHVTLKAERDVIMAFSCCPQDVTTINGPDRTVRDCLIEVLPPSGEGVA
jgi:uncharacterized protein YcgI (DUF1989 family)